MSLQENGQPQALETFHVPGETPNGIKTEDTGHAGQLETPKAEDIEEPRELAKPELAKSEQPPAKKFKTESSAPVHEMVGGSSVRQYLNKNLTKHLLEGLKAVSKEQPSDPLEALAQFLLKRSAELKASPEAQV